MVDKVDNPTPQDEPRMTFDYSRVTELLPGAHLEMSSKVHDHLANPCHNSLFSADLKHAYLTIPLPVPVEVGELSIRRCNNTNFFSHHHFSIEILSLFKL